MYIWIILATFITMLYSYSLPTREDMRSIYVEPQAEAVVAKVVEQHRTAREYIEAHKAGRLVNGIEVTTDSYYPGELKPSDLAPYFPYAFFTTKEIEDNATNNFISLIYCLNEDDEANGFAQLAPGCNEGGASCCGNEKSVTYLVTFGCIPQKWRSVKTGKPSNDFLNAIKAVAGLGTDMGYSDVKASGEMTTLNTNMVIRSDRTGQVIDSKTLMVSIPQFIATKPLVGEGTHAVSDGRSFNERCGETVLAGALNAEPGLTTSYDRVTGIPTESGAVSSNKCNYCAIYMTAMD